MAEYRDYRAERLARSEQRRAEKRREQWWRLLWVVPAGVVALAVLVVCFDLLLFSGKIHKGVEVSGIALGGKTRPQAEALLDETLTRYQQTPVTVTAGDLSWDIRPASIGLSFNARAMVGRAWSVGRATNVVTALRQRASAWFKPVAIEPDCSTDSEKAAKVFKRLQTKLDHEPQDFGAERRDGGFVVVDGSNGAALNLPELVQRLSAAVLEQRTQVAAPVEVVPVAVTRGAAQAAVDLAQAAVAHPIAVTYKDKMWTLEGADLVRLIEFKRSDELGESDVALPRTAGGGTGAVAGADSNSASKDASAAVALEVLFSAKAVDKRLIPLLGASVGSEPKDAAFEVRSGVVHIVPSKNGSGVDSQQLANELAGVALLPANAARSVAVIMRDVEPKLTTAKAESFGIKERISTYSTTFSAGNAPRVNNIRLLAKGLDGTLIAPGATFSLNNTIGERTAAKGYQEAGAIVKGELVQQVGGGICQVNTTLFNATLLSGVEITQRHNHSTYIDHYPLGRDATVSWDGPDFCFKNTLDNYVLIMTAVSDSSVTVSFYGVDPNYTVSLQTGEFKRTDFKTKEIKDAELVEGKRVVEIPGQRGGRVVLTQTVRKGDKVIRTATYTSNYITVTEVVRVGTKKKPTTDPGEDQSKDGSKKKPVTPVPAPAVPETGN